MTTLLEFTPRDTVVVAILVLFLGKYLTSKVAFLRDYNIPEPVSGGLIASILFGVAYGVFGLEFSFALGLRDALLITFFTTIGLSSKFSTLVEGGKPLLILLVLAVAYLFLQNFTGLAWTRVMGQPGEIGLIGGSVSLSGGARDGDRLGSEVRRGVWHRQCHGGWDGIRHVRAHPGRSDRRSDREIHDHALSAIA